MKDIFDTTGYIKMQFYSDYFFFKSFIILYYIKLKSQLFGKDTDVGKDWGQEERVVTEDEMVG